MTLIRLSKPPIRIQRKRTRGYRLPENTVYVGRPTKWGNPYVVGWHPEKGYIISQEKAVDLYYGFLFKGDLLDHIRELTGKNLACFCSLDEPCHADILLDIANRQ